MIAIFLPELGLARQLAYRFFGDNRPRTDGPFRLLYGDAGRTELRLYVVETGKGTYAAARQAARRGCEKLIPITWARVEEEVAAQEGIDTGTFLPVRSIWDLSNLENLMRLLPDSAETFPVEVDGSLPEEPLWTKGDEALACGTLPFPLKSTLLAQYLFEQRGIALADEHLAGYAKGAEDAGVELEPYAFCPYLLNQLVHGAKPELETGRLLEESFSQLLSSI